MHLTRFFYTHTHFRCSLLYSANPIVNYRTMECFARDSNTTTNGTTVWWLSITPLHLPYSIFLFKQRNRLDVMYAGDYDAATSAGLGISLINLAVGPAPAKATPGLIVSKGSS